MLYCWAVSSPWPTNRAAPAPPIQAQDQDDAALRRDDDAGDVAAVDGDNTGDGDGTRGNDGTHGGDNTGDGDATNGNDGTGGGDNTGDGGGSGGGTTG